VRHVLPNTWDGAELLIKLHHILMTWYSNNGTSEFIDCSRLSSTGVTKRVSVGAVMIVGSNTHLKYGLCFLDYKYSWFSSVTDFPLLECQSFIVTELFWLLPKTCRCLKIHHGDFFPHTNSSLTVTLPFDDL